MSAAVEQCRAWGTLRGCRFGADCKYQHTGEQGAAARTRVATKNVNEVCKGWSSERGCRYGDKCPYQHSGPGKLFVEKSAAEKAAEPCRNWKAAKGCKAGDACPYKHEGATGKVDKPAREAGAAAAASSDKPRRRRGRGSRGGDKPAGAAPAVAAKPAAPKEKKPVVKVDEECNNWKSDKGCWKGADCKYKHVGPTGNANPEAPPERRRGGRGGAAKEGAAAAATGAPRKCKWFNSPDGCKQGKDCKFSHE